MITLDGSNGGTASAGWYAQSAFAGTFSDGIVVDYTTGTGRITVGSSDGVTIYNGGTGARSALLNLDSSGNMGLGVTPSGWVSTYSQKAIQVGPVGSFSSLYVGSGNHQANLGNNVYDLAGTAKYIASGYASYYQQGTGAHAWYTAPSGTAGTAITFTQAMTLDASGNLGIGTSSPTTKVDLAGALANTGILQRLTANSSGANAKIQFGDIASYNWTFGTTGNAFTWSSSEYSTVTGTERMRLDSSGNLGIGTSSPSARLHAYVTSGGVSAQIETTASDQASVNLFNATRKFRLIADGSANALVIYDQTAGSERARIDSSGNFLVGTTSGSGKIVIKQPANNYTGGLSLYRSDSTDYWYLYSATSGNNFYIGVDGTDKGYFSSSTGAYTAVSDSRLKKNIENLNYGLVAVLNLRPVIYNMIDENDSDKKHIGLIAQEVKAVMDEAVDDLHGEQDFYGLDKSGLVPVLVKAIQELAARVAQLESK